MKCDSLKAGMDPLQQCLQNALQSQFDESQQSNWLKQTAACAYTSATGYSIDDIDETDWRYAASISAAHRLLSKINHLKRQSLDPSTQKKKFDSIVTSAGSSFFYAPETVERLYDPRIDNHDPLILKGVNCHCQLLERASGHAAQRYASSIQRAGLDAETVRGDLYSAALEEIVKCLSDHSARVWKAGANGPVIFPPEGTRGWKQSMVTHAAIDSDAKNLALLHSDRMLSIWSIETQELIAKHSLSSYCAKQHTDEWRAPFFSTTGENIAVQVTEDRVVIISLDGSHQPVVLEKKEKNRFQQLFGDVLPPACNLKPFKSTNIQTRRGGSLSMKDYHERVYHCVSSQSGDLVTTASEIERFMPSWMCDIGFENAVFYILKRRLIDRIRKHIHIEAPSIEEVSNGEFTPSQAIGVYHTGKNLDDMSSEELVSHSARQTDDWRDAHDLERILAVLKTITITYKDKEIRCDKLARLKAEGKTNAEIGEILQAPRGTVDYLWNQCRKQIALIFGDEI